MKNRYITLENGNEIELPMYELVEERIKFCQELIDSNYQDFCYDLPENDAKFNFMDRVVKRLDTLGYYLCELVNKDDRNVITEWQEEYYQKHMKNPKKGLYYNEFCENF